jgi:hypothetical protein
MTLDPATLNALAQELDEMAQTQIREAEYCRCGARQRHTIRAALLRVLAADYRTRAICIEASTGEVQR